MRTRQYDAAVEAALGAARAADLWAIVRIQDAIDRRLVIEDGRVSQDRTTRVAGLGVHVFTAEGSVGFASVDDLSPEAARQAVERAGRLARALGLLGGARTDAHRQLATQTSVDATCLDRGGSAVSERRPYADSEIVQALREAQTGLADVQTGASQTSRTSFHAVDEEWRIARTDGTDVAFSTSRAQARHDISSRLDGRVLRSAAAVAADCPHSVVSDAALARLDRRTRSAARDAQAAAGAPPPRAGSYRLVLNHALAKGLAHEAIGHLCESDVDGSVLMRGGRLRLGDRLARPTVSIVDGPLGGDFAQQPISANGIPRETVTLIERGVLANGLGDLFSAAQAGIQVTGACRASSFRDRPSPRMTNIRLQIDGALPLAGPADDLTPDDVLAELRRHGLLDRTVPTLYLAGYRGGQAHPRRGDFVFGAEAAYDLTDGGAPRGPASFTGLAERALAAIVAGIGPLCLDAIGTCNKDGSPVSSSGGSHALIVLDPDPDLVVSAAP